jgi:hypothetical protein
MSYADAKARLVTHAQAASASLTRPFEDIQVGIALPKGKSIRVYYGGEVPPVRMGGRYTLNSEMVGKATLIQAFWPLPTVDDEMFALIDTEAEAFSHAFRTAVDADTDLNGNVDNTTLEDGEPAELIVGTTRYMTILWRAVTDYVEYPIAKP